MPHVSAAQAVDLWERGADRTLAQRAELLAAIALPDASRAQVQQTGIGRRDRAILALRDATLGSRMDCFVECRQCRTRLEFAFEARELLASETAADLDADSYELEIDGWQIRYRPPTGADVAEVAARFDGDSVRHALLQRCTLAIARTDQTPASSAARATRIEHLPEAVLDALESALEAHDPLTQASFSTVCAACGHACDFRFDIVAFFSTELFALAKRLLHEVDVLARVYHWREADVLAMSAVRRRCYVESALG
jgi:hypothetical protein